MDTLIGQTIGPYKITERVGEGGMAVVYKGYQQSLNRYVAIKVLRGELAEDEQFVARFRQEALAVAGLSHPNILHVYDAGTAFGMYYIVMAYVEGGSLRDLITQGPLEVDYAVSITMQLADALDHAHRQGLVHRDVKPNNVLISRDGRPLLTDFGIAKALGESKGLTRTGTAIGTPEYMSPEQIQGQQVDGRTDIYSLGIVLYEMLVGWAPFSSTTPVAALYKQVNEPPPPLRQANINVPAWLEAVVGKALAKRPQERYQHAGEFADALRERRVVEKAKTPVPVTPPRQEKKPPAERKRLPAEGKQQRKIVPLLIGGIALLLLIVVVIAIVLLSGGTEGPPQGTPRVVTITRVITPTPKLPSPVPLKPVPGEAVAATVSFQWMWNGPALGPNQAFSLRIWSQAEEDAKAEPQPAITPTTQTAIDLDLATVPTVQQHGPGSYFWMVAVVDTGTGNLVSEWGEKRSFTYTGP